MSATFGSCAIYATKNLALQFVINYGLRDCKIFINCYQTEYTLKKKSAKIYIMKIIIPFVFLTIPFYACSQMADNTGSHNKRNIYYQALAHYLKLSEKDVHYDTVLIYKDNKTTDSLLTRIGQTVLIMVEDPYDYLKKHQIKYATLFSIFPLAYQNKEFSVSFVPFSAHINPKTHELFLENSGSYKVVFKFENDRFTFLRTEDHGI